MAKTKYHIILSDEERARLTKIIQEGKESERTIMRARILLASDETVKTEKYSVEKLARELGTTGTTIQTTRTEYAKEGLEASVFRKERVVSMKTRRVNEDVIRQIWEMSDEVPPAGHKRWTIQLLCDESIARGIVSKIGPTSMAQVMKQKEQHKRNCDLSDS